MNKKLGITVVTFVFLLAGCGSNQPSSNASKDSSTPKSQVSTNSLTQSNTATSAGNGNSTNSGTAAQEKPVNNNEKPLPPEKNPVGDIPDSQAFVNYSSAEGGYSIQAPEGWSRTENGTDVDFIDKFDGVKTSIETDANPFTLENIKNNQVKNLIANGRAIKIVEIREVTLPGGKAVVVKYNSNSEPNGVTIKQIRLENQTFYFNQNGKIGTLTVWAPLGADNVDQWKKISESWRWK